MSIVDVMMDALLDALPIFAAVGLVVLLAGAWAIGFIEIKEQVEREERQRQDNDRRGLS